MRREYQVRLDDFFVPPLRATRGPSLHKFRRDPRPPKSIVDMRASILQRKNRVGRRAAPKGLFWVS